MQAWYIWQQPTRRHASLYEAVNIAGINICAYLRITKIFRPQGNTSQPGTCRCLTYLFQEIKHKEPPVGENKRFDSGLIPTGRQPGPFNLLTYDAIPSFSLIPVYLGCLLWLPTGRGDTPHFAGSGAAAAWKPEPGHARCAQF